MRSIHNSYNGRSWAVTSNVPRGGRFSPIKSLQIPHQFSPLSVNRVKMGTGQVGFLTRPRSTKGGSLFIDAFRPYSEWCHMGY